MIQIDKLAFSYGSNEVLKNISMEILPGNIYGLLGENGVGKTTLLTLLCGLKKVQSGSIRVDGRDPYDREPSLLADQFYLADEVAPVHAKAICFAREHGVFWPNFDLSLFSGILREFEVEPDQYMDAMSAGQLKKTYLSFALACRVRYYYLDEPTNGLDIPSKSQFRKALMKYVPEESSIVISTHQVRDLENIIDPIIILDRRDVLLNASTADISEKLFFDYSTELHPDALYVEQTPGGTVQVYPNPTGEESKVNVEALFNAVHAHKDVVKAMFNPNL
ncbi:MAG: ATP-binding cassette domain-containing protein [Bacteroidales bacterium]|nr:ATP-binding cassette domain-containing protein [Bacteroidales bacterium]